MNSNSHHSKTQLVIIAEAIIEKQLIKDAQDLGVHTWTVTEVHGGSVEGIRDGAWEPDRTIELKLICDTAVAEAIADHVLKTYAPNYAVAIYFSEVRVLRPDRFWQRTRIKAGSDRG